MKLSIAATIMFVLSIASIGCSNTAKKETETKAPAPVATETKAPAPPAPTNAVKCKNSKEERTIEIETVQPKGCKVWYTKSGQRQNIASSSQGTQHCENVSGKIKTNLQSAGYTCQ